MPGLPFLRRKVAGPGAMPAAFTVGALAQSTASPPQISFNTLTSALVLWPPVAGRFLNRPHLWWSFRAEALGL